MTKQKYQYLSNEFLEKYKGYNPLKTQLGMFTYVRTYSQYLPDEKRREYWLETVARAVDYNVSLGNGTVREAEMLFDNVFNLRQFLSGRTLWAGGGIVSKNYPMSNYNCFSGDTEFLTKDGLVTFKEAYDKLLDVEVLNGNGAWSKATVNEFGEKEIYQLTIRRFGTKYTRTIKTTEKHEWFVKKGNEKRYELKSTIDLLVGDKLRIKRRYEHTEIKKCQVGVQHGLVYGDGTFDKKKGFCSIKLIGDKCKHEQLFNTGSHLKVYNDTLIYGLPYYWKELPPVNANPEYISGFLYGLSLADASKSGSMKLVQKDYTSLKHIRSLFETIGITTSEISVDVRVNSNFGEHENCHKLTVHKESIPKDWDNFYDESAIDRDWVVESVKNTNRTEVVYCVTEPITNSFTLSGGVHTHNCAFGVIDDLDIFHEIFYLLLVGSGVGFRALQSDVDKLPKFRSDIQVHHKYYEPVHQVLRKEYTGIISEYDEIDIVVGDSKEAWTQSLKIFLELFTSSSYKKVNHINFIYDNVRPKGERLKTFGGFASGHESLHMMFVKLTNIIKKLEFGKAEPIDVIDILNIIGEGVVSGGVRRTAEIALIDVTDKTSMQMKNNIYNLINGEWVVNEEILHRQMSNNSIYYHSKPTREFFHWQLQQMRFSGEPAWVNEEAGKKRRENFNGVNPCAEILLDSRGMCNLTEVNVMAFVTDGKLDYGKLFEAQSLSVRAGMRMTLPEFELHKWDVINKRDRLIGASLTGWQDMVNATSMSVEEQSDLLKLLRETAHNTAEAYAIQLGINEPLLKTTIKPSGTLSLLPSVSAGIHYSHSEYYIRRVRISYNDPLAKAMIKMGYNWNPEVGQTVDNMSTIVIDFPVKAPVGITKTDVSAIQQLENYKMFMRDYVDHNVSITVHVKDNEWDEVEQWTWDNWDDIVAVSFIPYNDSFYQLMPYEEITKEQYDELLSNTPAFDYSVLSEFESGAEFELGESCDTGICPIR